MVNFAYFYFVLFLVLQFCSFSRLDVFLVFFLVFRCDTICVVYSQTIKPTFFSVKGVGVGLNATVLAHSQKCISGGGTQILQIPYCVRGIRKLCENKNKSLDFRGEGAPPAYVPAHVSHSTFRNRVSSV